MSNLCCSIRNKNQPNLRCLFNAKNGCKYCSIHITQTNVVDYNPKNEEFFSSIIDNPETSTNISTLYAFKELKENLPKINEIKLKEPQKKADIKKSIKNNDYNINTVADTYQDNEDDLEIKLLILVNNGDNVNIISELIGPVFHDITCSEDEHDPITYDPIWSWDNGKKVPAKINKYFMFSYTDNNGKIRCFTIFTIHDIINSGNYVHPVTTEKIPDIDIDRAKKLIEFYKQEIGLFSEQNDVSDEFKQKLRLTKLFNKFHVHSIYIEEDWLLSIDNSQNLSKIITETYKLIKNNLYSINPKLKTSNLFDNKEYHKLPKKGSKSDLEKLKSIMIEYIIDQWEKLIESADNPNNQVPIWILISGLSFVIPEIKQKFPNLEIML
ncbi:hypothetical protein QLL95_gp1097 [Cotonvirus japonicus]|uniref:Uncharacterized protein n=1 Tax=Cotonvirus japonicus TaxID=2811091 RepID=A0ABM7NSD9_9VIRU|nr:hypothetical protein QLL95_gp1097 [Cotonvirus japonicus]BCS83026.1 hypothetical protein [Cotonvirus japonicus]